LSEDAFVAEFLQAPFPCCLTSLDKDGRPYSVVVWCAPDGDRITVNAADGLWLRNLRRDPRVALVIVDTGNILRHVNVQGKVVDIQPDEGYAHIDALSRIYEGRRYQYSFPEDIPRFKVTIEPDRIRTLDLEPQEEEVR
jgi:PPOX class probable F420-dependent enzyme